MAGNKLTELNGLPKLNQRGYTAILALFSLLGMVFILLNTRLGVVLTDDSYYYVKPALDATAGKGFNPSTMFAPLLPAVLLVFKWLGIEPQAVARFMNAILFGIAVWFAAGITRQITRSSWAALLAGLWVLLSENLLDGQSWLMSEALFYTFVVISLWAVLRYYPQRSRTWLLVTSFFVMLACLARFAGLSLLVPIALALLLDRRAAFKQRLKDAGLFVLIAFAPIGLYFIRNIIVSGYYARYTFYVFEPFLLDNLVWYLYNVLSWFVPGRLLHGRELLVGAGFLVTVGLVFYWARRRGVRFSSEHAFILICLGGYLAATFGMLFVTRGYLELGVYKTRFIVPLLLVLLPLFAWALAALWNIAGRFVRPVLILISLAFRVFYGWRAYDFISYTNSHGLGYANVGWHNSETVQYLRSNPQIQVVSTGEMGIYFWTGRLPAVIGTYGDVDGLYRHLCSSSDVLVIMDQMPTALYGMDYNQVIKGLQLVKSFNNSEMYRCAAPQSSQGENFIQIFFNRTEIADHA